MSLFDVTLVTYAGIPDLTPDDQRLAAELARRGLRVRSAIWSDETTDWSASKLTVIRSVWDYFHRPTEFLTWLARIEKETRVINSPAVIRWNYDKHYLGDLLASGIRTVPTLFADESSSAIIAGAVSMFETNELVIKPAVGGASWGARRFAWGREDGEALAHLAKLVEAGSALIQPFLGSVLVERERSLVFFDGTFSHSYLKVPFSGGMGGTEEIVHQATPAELALAASVLQSVEEQPAYARVDMALLEGQPHLMELELIEPALHFYLAPGSEGQMADALERRIGAKALRPIVGRAA